MKPTGGILADIAGGEGQRCEFKERLDNPERIAGEIAAFANSEGGALYVGVDDHGNICGLDNAETVFQTLTNICRDRCIPAISPVIEHQTIEGKEIVVAGFAVPRISAKRAAGNLFCL